MSGVEEDRATAELRKWFSTERQRARREATDHHLRETFPSHPDALPAAPTFRGRGGGPGVSPAGVSDGMPATLTVEADDVEVPSDAEGPVEFTDILRQNLVDWSGPSNEIIWPIAGTVFFYVDGAWDDLDPGETYAEVLVDGVVVWNVWISSSPAALTITLVAEDVEVANDTPTLIEFTIEARNQGVNAGLPTDEVVWPVAGVVQAYVHGRWDTLDDPGQWEVEVLVDDVAVWPDL